ncbi:ent-kaurene oxidase [Diaporthe eres]|nr:ent-kaurene oxidase [Diaporthe eres]
MVDILPVSGVVALTLSVFALVIALLSTKKIGRAQCLSSFLRESDEDWTPFTPTPWILRALWYPVSFLKCRVLAWLFLTKGPDILQDAYCQSKGAAFLVDVPENRYLVFSSWDRIREIDKAPDDVLSLQAAAKEILQPKYSMHGFNWFDQRGLEGTPLIRTLRTLLTNHLPVVLPELRYLMSAILDEHHESAAL